VSRSRKPMSRREPDPSKKKRGRGATPSDLIEDFLEATPRGLRPTPPKRDSAAGAES
jgi:hypothetical protein